MDEMPLEAGGEAAAAEQGAPTGAPPWVDALESSFAERLGQLGDELGGRIDQRLGPQESEPGYEDEFGVEPDDDDLDDDEFLERFAREFDDPEQDERSREELCEVVAEELAPLHEAERQRQWQELYSEFPSLATEAGARPVLHAAVDMAHQIGDPRLAAHPQFARLVFLAQHGEERAAAEQPAEDGSKVALEQGGGTPSEPAQDHLMQQLWAETQNRGLHWD